MECHPSFPPSGDGRQSGSDRALSLTWWFAHSTAARPPKRSCRNHSLRLANVSQFPGYYLKHADELALVASKAVMASSSSSTFSAWFQPPR